MKRTALIALSFCLLTLAVSPASAHHRKEVLGDTTTPSDVKFPQIASGPGFFLPDSPFYFLDQISQGVKVAFAFSPERKAQIRSQIAGERLAELRVMLERDDKQGIQTALRNFTHESELAAEAISDAGARSGTDVRGLAKELNTTIKAHRKVLKELEKQTSGDLKLQLKASRESLKRAKVEIEDELPEDEFEKELQEDLDEIIEDEVEEASRSAKGLEHAISVLEKLASQAAEKNQPAREAALRRAIEKKNAKLQSQEQRKLQREQKKREKKMDKTKKAIGEARETVKQAQEAAMRFKVAKEEAENDELIENEIDNESVHVSSSGNSESGSSNSGSGSSNSGKNSSQ